MKTETKNYTPFEFLWNEAIFPAIEQCVQECDKKFACLYSIIPSFTEKYQNRIHKQYITLREQYKDVMHKEGANALLDFTKLASIICFTLIENKPFGFEIKDDLVNEHIPRKYFIDNVLINYKIAIYAAINITYISLLTEYNTSNDPEKICINEKESYEKLKEAGSLKIYTVGGKKREIPDGFTPDTLLETLIKNLYFLDSHNRDFDITAYAVILDGLREYTRLYYDKTTKVS